MCNHQTQLAETISIPAIICAIDTTVIVVRCVSLSVYPEKYQRNYYNKDILTYSLCIEEPLQVICWPLKD